MLQWILQPVTTMDKKHSENLLTGNRSVTMLRVTERLLQQEEMDDGGRYEGTDFRHCT